MSKFILAAGAAALAVAAPAFADKGGNGGGHGQGHGGGGQQMRGPDHGNGGGGQQVRGNGRGGGDRMANGNQGRMQLNRQVVEPRGNGRDRMVAKVENRKADRGPDMRERMSPRDMRGNERRAEIGRIDNRIEAGPVRDYRVKTSFIPQWTDGGQVRGFGDACPPGLAKKNNGCLPPGLAAKRVGTALPALYASNVLSGPYSQWYRDDDQYYYRYDDDYIYRVRRDGGLIDALFPSIDRDYYYYPVGYEYPTAYNSYNVPYQYRSYYPDGGDWAYRYGDGAIYRVDPNTNLISGIASLLAGDLSVGQQLPSDYMVYNVPYDYRDRYYDTADNWYRYNDGYIYRVDPKTQLITAVINALI